MIELGANLSALVERFEGVGPISEEALARRAVALLDLTRLDDGCDEAAVAALCRRAETRVGPVAAVCVRPRFVAFARDRLDRAGSGVHVAAVVNYPSGDDDVAGIGAEASQVVAAGADEIELVLPYRRYLAGEREEALAAVTACRAVIGPDLILKVILETGCFRNSALLGKAAREVAAAGADFLKTSTGTVVPGATLSAAAVLLAAIHEQRGRVGLKVSGGIRDTAAAARYLALTDAVMGPEWAGPSTFRIGASALLDALLEMS